MDHKYPTERNDLVQSGNHDNFIELELRHDTTEKKCILNNKQSLNPNV